MVILTPFVLCGKPVPNKAKGGFTMNDLYKVYDPDDNVLLFDSLRELRLFFDLDAEDTHKVFMKHCYTTKDGITVIHFWK